MVGGGGGETISRFERGRGRNSGGGCETPPSRVSSEGGVVVGRKGGGGCENSPSRVSSEGEACGGW